MMRKKNENVKIGGSTLFKNDDGDDEKQREEQGEKRRKNQLIST